MSRTAHVVLALVVALSGCRREQRHVARQAPLPPPAHAQVPLPGGRSIADVAAQVTPSVVNVFSERETGVLGIARRHALSLGSGVIVGPDGLIVTNQHVVEHAEAIAVVLKDGRELRARLVGADPRSDVAVLRVDAHDLPPIQFADSSKLRVGDLVLAIGDPFGIGQTVTMGIISATGRANLGIADVEDFIQTDAAINPGNSGGALVDMDGKLVGIATAIVSRSGGYQGIGFAIPSNMVRQVADQIAHHGKVTRGWLGVATDDVGDDLAEALHVAPRSGVVITTVAPGSPAAHGGLAVGDVITSIDGVPVTDPAHLRNLVALAGPKRIRVLVMRDGRPQQREVVLIEAPAGESPPTVKDEEITVP